MVKDINSVTSALNNSPLLRKPVNFSKGQAHLFFDDLIDRINPRLRFAKKRVLLATVQKSGSHLLINFMAGLRCFFRNYMILASHWPYEFYRNALAAMPKERFAWGHVGTLTFVQIAQALNLKVIVLVRDPRDVLLSFIDHVVTLKPHFLSLYYQSLSTDEERILATIEGVPKEIIHSSLNVVHTRLSNANEFRTYLGLSGIGDVFRNFLAWEDYADVFFLRFEDLVGVQGGGQDDIQKEKITALCSFLQISRNMHEDKFFLKKISKRETSTFSNINKGQINRWKRVGLSKRVEEAFKESCGDVLIRLGYERDFDW